MQRAATEHHLFDGDAGRLGAWVWLVAKACWKPTKFNVNGKTITLERGQFCGSVRDLAEAWGWSKSTVDRFLTRLKTETMIRTDSGTGRLVITICNYEKYQVVGKSCGTPSGTPSGTRAGHERDIKEQGNQETRLFVEANASTAQKQIEDECLEDTASSETNLFSDPVEQTTSAQPELKPEHVVEVWNDLASEIGRPSVRDLTPERRALLKARIAAHSVDDFTEAIDRIRASPFLRGEKKWSGVTFDWFIKKSNFLKILEGNYSQ